MELTWIKGEEAPTFQDALSVRDAVFTQEQGFAAEIDHDALDKESWQLVLYQPSTVTDCSETVSIEPGRSVPVGTLRFFLNEEGDYQIGRVAILKAFRGQNLGALMLREALKKCAALALSHRVILHSQTHAKGFYERYGFVAEGEEFLEDGEPHITMTRSLLLGKIPAETLAKADKVLFIAHLAIGDFTYLQNGFRAFKAAYPHIAIDLFVEDVRCTRDSAKWPALKQYSLYDWLEASPLFRKIYRENYSPDLRLESILEAKREEYPIVISIETLTSLGGAALARDIAGQSEFSMAMALDYKWYQWGKKSAEKAVNATIEVVKPYQGIRHHISEDYAYWFAQMAGIILFDDERYPYVEIPAQWQDHAKETLQSWGHQAGQKIVFINHIAKNPRRSWLLTQVSELIVMMQQLPKWQEALFIINGVPEIFEDIETMIQAANLQNVVPFSARDNFFELPAMLAESDLIISVETAVMHLANAVHVPVIALMRLKTPEWAPLNPELTTIIFNEKRSDVISDIPPSRVIEALPKA